MFSCGTDLMWIHFKPQILCMSASKINGAFIALVSRYVIIYWDRIFGWEQNRTDFETPFSWGIFSGTLFLNVSSTRHSVEENIHWHFLMNTLKLQPKLISLLLGTLIVRYLHNGQVWNCFQRTHYRHCQFYEFRKQWRSKYKLHFYFSSFNGRLFFQLLK